MSHTPAESDLLVSPRDSLELWLWISRRLDIQVPRSARCLGHRAPFDYLDHSFFQRPGDPLVWANRGGGKTYYAALATLLDLLFRPGIQVRILGGSLDQSRRMYDYLRTFLSRPGLEAHLERGATRRGLALRNGSRVEILAQAETSVRGHHVQKLRCDEVDLFEREIWSAAQFVTKSRDCGGHFVRGSVEALSTMHRQFGLMKELVEQAGTGANPAQPREQGGDPLECTGSAGPWSLFNWCALDVLGGCPPPLSCDGCDLWEPCGGSAKQFDTGFFAVRDALAIRSRSSRHSFNAEMLCRTVSRSDMVYPAFDPAVHVRDLEPDRSLKWVGGMDFGIRGSTVMLWAQIRRNWSAATSSPGRVSLRIEVLDEYISSDQDLPSHLAAMAGRCWPPLHWVAVDPAARQRDLHTGLSTVELLTRSGYRVRDRRVSLPIGLDVVRRHMEAADPAAGPALLVHSRCRGLIEALCTYHFDPDDPRREQPIKDGPDHACDALRYLVTNLEAWAPAVLINYLEAGVR